ncbi:MAG: TPM domain-containing protein, partial [Chitinophagaceae bacterium]
MNALKKIMSLLRLRFPLLVILLAFVVAAVSGQVVPHNLLPPKPNPPKLVNDFANLLSPEEERQLEQKLVAYDDSTSNQVVIVTVKTMRGYEADQYATEIGHFWGVGGQAKYDNGVVILVSDGTEENGKRRYFIATGYGLEGAIPAITTNDIAQEFLVPNLKNNNYFDAFDQTTSAVIKAAAGEYKAPDNYRKGKGGGKGGGAIGFVILIIIILAIINRNNRGGGGFMSRRGYSGFPPIIFPGGGG